LVLLAQVFIRKNTILDKNSKADFLARDAPPPDAIILNTDKCLIVGHFVTNDSLKSVWNPQMKILKILRVGINETPLF